MISVVFQKTNTPNFKGTLVAKTKNVVKGINTDIDIYALDFKDKHFLSVLQDSIDMSKLMPGLSGKNYDRWHEMLEYAVINCKSPDRHAFLAVTENKPCGIAVFLPGKNKFHFDCICTWPVEFGKKVSLAGTTLFNQVFNVFKNSKASKIQLEAITDGPYDTVSKYSNLGFFKTGGYGHKILMETNQLKVKDSLKNLRKIIDYKPVKNAQRENLLNLLDI